MVQFEAGGTEPDFTLATPGSELVETRARVEIERGMSIGRYVALAPIGEGGMGVVWSALDPELDRQVAIKLLGKRLAGDKARSRLQREAQAMARLAHPNIVVVHDVGLVDGQVFVAMEQVRGQTLRVWQRERAWAEIVDAYRQAALGLAAAHEAGLVHRDFKPDNAMIDAQGRVRVMDFGLAAAREADLAASHDIEERLARIRLDDLPIDRSTGDLLATPMTEVGSLLGTPAFMAPEQLSGRGGGPAADQFALCVSLWLALFGERPYRGETIDALLQAMREGRLREPPSDTEVPTRITDTLRRGLAYAPEQRWPSIAALAEQLEPETPSQARTVGWLVGALLLAVGFAVLGLASRESAADSCRASAIDAVWTDTQAEVIADAMQSAGAHGRAAWQRTEPAIVEHVEQWREVFRGACLQSDGLPEQLRVAQAVCLERSETALAATLELLAEADAEIAAHALDMVTSLPSPQRCADAERLADLERRSLASRIEPDDMDRARELQHGLDRARALHEAGRHRDALALLEPLREPAAAIGDPALQGELLAAIAVELLGSDREADAIETGTAAYAELLRAGEDRRAAKLAIALMLAHQGLAQIEQGRAWDLHAAALLDRSGAEPQLHADRLIALAALADGAGEFQDALRLYERGLELLPPDSLPLGRVLDEYGAVHSRLGQLEQAEAAEQRSLDILLAQLGPEHPEVGGTHFKLGNTSYRKGDLDAARRHFEQAIAIVEPALGPASTAVTGSLIGLGATALGLHDDAGAAGYFRAALERLERALGPTHPDLVPPLVNLGIALKRSGDLAGSEAVQLRALTLLETLRGPKHPDLLAVLDNLGELRLLRGDAVGAREAYARSLAIGEVSFGPTHPELDYALFGLGDCARAQGDLAAARIYYERVVAQPDQPGKNAALIEDARAQLAQLD